MSRFLLLDFGTTSTKSALVDLESGHFSRVQSHPAIASQPLCPGRAEVPLDAIAGRFEQICARYLPFAGIALCSEMHGFAALDEGGAPLSPYISWKDERCLEEVDGLSTLDLLCRELGDGFKTITGMKPRPGFALLNFLHLARSTSLPSCVRLVDLPGWLCRAAGRPRGYAHPTLLAGMACYDVQKEELSAALLSLVRRLAGVDLLLDDPVAEGEVAGYWRDIPLYAAVGDHQCSLLGAGLVSTEALSANLGTGSQVSAVDGRVDLEEAETRPYFSGRRLRTITHIPGGRALSEYMGFLQEVAGDRRDVWALLGQVRIEQMQQSSLDFDLAVFAGARRFGRGGAIGRILEGRLTLENYLASLLRSFAGQYVEVARLFDPEGSMKRLVLSGGVARRLPVLGPWLEAETGYQVLPATDLDESLLGLRTLALVAAGRAPDALEAQGLFGRESVVDDA